ncbi:MAG TPA: IS110 family transposase [Dongiaceae bacterium]|nr:IS110 family transposase [Dongiaceae bacterium]
MTCNQQSRRTAAIRGDDAVLLVSLELSCASWLVTSLSPGSETMSKHSVAAGDGAALLQMLSRLRAKAEQKKGCPVRVVVIQEAGLDGFWVHRLLEAGDMESHVVDPASIAVSRQRRRAKSDRIDGEALLRTLLAWRRGEPRVCSMVAAPSVQEEDRRRLVRERQALVASRTQETNRMRGLLATQGISGYNPVRRDRRQRLERLTTGDGRALPPYLMAELARALDRIELLLRQLAAVEAARDALVQAMAPAQSAPAAPLLLRLRGVGRELAAVLYLEGFFRSFANRRQVAAYAGLCPSPWRSGGIDHDQGISKAGNPRLRQVMVELAWLWLRYQPDSALSRWFRRRVGEQGGRVRRIAIVALARKLLVALWRYVTQGVVPEGATLKAA